MGSFVNIPYSTGNFLFDVMSKIFNVTVQFSDKRTNSLSIQFLGCEGKEKEIQNLVSSLAHEITPNAPGLKV